MFYVPQKTLFPKQKLSLKFISKIQGQFKSKRQQNKSLTKTKKGKSQRKRFKTLCQNADRVQNVSLQCKQKKSLVVVLPSIFEKRFLLKGKITGQQKERSCSTKKIEPVKETKTGRGSIRQPKKKRKQIENTQIDYFQLEPWQGRDRQYD